MLQVTKGNCKVYDIMKPDARVVLREVPLRKIRYVSDRTGGRRSEGVAEEQVLALRQGVAEEGAYPWQRLIGSIRKHGWDPAYRDRTYRGEMGGYTPFYVVSREGFFYPSDDCRHRYAALKFLGIDPVLAFVVEPSGMSCVNKEELRSFLRDLRQHLRGKLQGVSLYYRLPYGLSLPDSDRNKHVFGSTGWKIKDWCGRSVLVVGSGIGCVALEAKRRGAKRVVGFDTNGLAVGFAKKLSRILRLEAEFFNCCFREFPLWGEGFDVIVAHDCLHDFSRVGGKGSKQETLLNDFFALVSDCCKEDFVTHTSLGSELEKHISSAGFSCLSELTTKGKSGRTLVASRQSSPTVFSL